MSQQRSKTDWLLALLFASVSLSAMKSAINSSHSQQSFISVTVAIFHFALLIATLKRTPAIATVTWSRLLACSPSLFLGALMWQVAKPSNFQIWQLGLYSSGLIIATIALFSLGDSFSVFPALRNTKTTGAYSYIRHPMYFGELLMAAALCDLQNLWTLAILPALIVTVAIRIHIEEKLLQLSPSYKTYCETVQTRLFPFIW